VNNNNLPIPTHFNRDKVDQIWQVDYQKIASEAEEWGVEFNINPSAKDSIKTCLLIIDAQVSFCIPRSELYVGGRSGKGAVDDNTRLCEFIYKNLNKITSIIPTLDTHTPMQIFHPIFLINNDGKHPSPATIITEEDVKMGKWKINPSIADNIMTETYDTLQKHLLHYTKTLENKGKYSLITWPYHAMLGSIGHALVPSVEEAIFFHTIARQSHAQFELKGFYPLTENYSVLSPELTIGINDKIIANKNINLINKLLSYDKIFIAGQAKSHCVAWTIDDLLNEINLRDKDLTKKVYLLEDCTSSVVIPNVIDFTDQANETFIRFSKTGMNLIKSSEFII